MKNFNNICRKISDLAYEFDRYGFCETFKNKDESYEMVLVLLQKESGKEIIKNFCNIVLDSSKRHLYDDAEEIKSYLSY